jgi:hypothetical protein
VSQLQEGEADFTELGLKHSIHPDVEKWQLHGPCVPERSSL